MTDSTITPRRSRSARRRFRHWRRDVRNRFLGWIGPWLVRLWVGTVRFRWHGPLPSFDASGRQPVIYAFWHQRFLGFVSTHRGRGVRVLISRHRDGELLSRVMSPLGFVPVRGSTTRGGTSALRSLLREGTGGYDLAVTPDGPRGPLHCFQPGTAFLASRTGMPVVLATIAYARAFRLPTWDRFLLPWPWTRAVARVVDPIAVPPDLSDDEIETWRSRLETALRELTVETDERFEALYDEAGRNG